MENGLNDSLNEGDGVEPINDDVIDDDDDEDNDDDDDDELKGKHLKVYFLFEYLNRIFTQ